MLGKERVGVQGKDGGVQGVQVRMGCGVQGVCVCV